MPGMTAGSTSASDDAARAEPRDVGARLAERRHRAEADVEVGELRDPLGHRLLTEPGADAPEHLLALRPLGELLLDELRHAEALAEGAPEVRLEGAHRHVAAVPGLVDGVAGVVAGEHGVAARRLLPLGEV